MNERMTKRDTDGQAMMDCEKCKADWTGKHGKPMAGCTALYCRNRLLGRLVEYEDTGLTPEEIKAPFTEDTMINLEAQALGVEPSRLRELAEADKDGRVVVMPCRQGDELWTYCNHPVKRVYSFTVSDVSTLNGRTVLNTLGLGTIRPEDISKTVFRTREEAERAIQGMEGKKDG